MVAAFDNGATLRELATRFGINRKTITKHLRQAGCDTGRRYISDAKAKRIHDLRASGLSCAAIAKVVGVSSSSVWEVLRRTRVAA
jgi:predicted DNA binding protein